MLEDKELLELIKNHAGATYPFLTAQLIQAELNAILESNKSKPAKTEDSLVQPLTAKTSSGDADDQQLMREILNQMKELTQEVRAFRKELDLNQRNMQTETQKTEQMKSAVQLQEVEHAILNSVQDIALSSEENDDDIQIFDVPFTSDETISDDSSPPINKKNKTLSVISSILFYFIIIALVFGAFLIRSSGSSKPWSIAGYSAMTVLTGSMEDVYPQGSLIITKTTDADKLKIGDDITYMTGETSSITHRIIGITENYLETGERGFETKGVMNANPDKEIVAAGNVVGKVVFCSTVLGATAKFITTNWPLLLFLIVVLVLLIAFLQWNARRPDDEE